MTRPIRILGIDPGLRRTGWGVVEIAGNRLGFIGCGSVTTNDRDALAARLLAIYDGLLRILDQYRPDEAAVEATFVNKDATATLKLGQARGIAMVVPAKAGVPVAEYAPNLVKKSIVGVGALKRLSAVRWGVAGRVVWAWIVTIPGTAAMAAILWLMLFPLA